MLKALGIALLASLAVTTCQSHQEVQPKERRVKYHTMYRTQQIDGLSIFYREAGPKDAPTLTSPARIAVIIWPRAIASR